MPPFRLTQPRVRHLIADLATEWYGQLTELEWEHRGRTGNIQFPTVYILTNDKLDCLYVGQTSNVAARMRSHESNHNVNVLDWTRCNFFVPGMANVGHRLECEGRLILALRPPGNRALMLKLTRARQWAQIRLRTPRRRAANG